MRLCCCAESKEKNPPRFQPFRMSSNSVFENSQFQSEIRYPVSPSERVSKHPEIAPFPPKLASDGTPETPSFGSWSGDQNYLEKLAEASTAEAEVANAIWQAAQTASINPEKILIR